jgi:hypothetical protein
LRRAANAAKQCVPATIPTNSAKRTTVLAARLLLASARFYLHTAPQVSAPSGSGQANALSLSVQSGMLPVKIHLKRKHVVQKVFSDFFL